MVDDAVIPRGVAEMGDREEAIVHFDGACQPARGGGVATYGFTIDSAHGHLEDAGLAVAPGIPHSTNNVAEYCAAIRALEQLVEDGYRGRVIVRGDSQLVIRQMTGEYEVRTEHLVAYHERLRQLLGTFSLVRFEWIPREENRRADELSKRALDEELRRSRRLRAPR